MDHVVLSPALPSELFAYVIENCVHPTTLVVCAARDAFEQAVVAEVAEGAETEDDLLPTLSLWQIAVSRHIRVAFVPTVAHLRGFLAAFDPAASAVPPPPAATTTTIPKTKPLLLVYDFFQLHRDTSEWSAQGLSASAAVLVEAADRAGFCATAADRRRRSDAAAESERLPVLSTVPRRQLQRAGYPLRTTTVGRALGPWFRFPEAAAWQKQRPHSAAKVCIADSEASSDDGLQEDEPFMMH